MPITLSPLPHCGVRLPPWIQACDTLDRQHGGPTIHNTDRGARRQPYFLENKGCSSRATKLQSPFLTTTKGTRTGREQDPIILGCSINNKRQTLLFHSIDFPKLKLNNRRQLKTAPLVTGDNLQRSGFAKTLAGLHIARVVHTTKGSTTATA